MKVRYVYFDSESSPEAFVRGRSGVASTPGVALRRYVRGDIDDVIIINALTTRGDISRNAYIEFPKEAAPEIARCLLDLAELKDSDVNKDSTVGSRQ